MRGIATRVSALTDWRALMHEPLARLEADVPDVLLTGGGEWAPGLRLPPHIVEAAATAVRRRPGYTHEYGLPELREALAAKLERDNQVRVDPATEIMVTNSATEAISITLRTLLEPGDELICGDPYYQPMYGPNVLATGAVVRSVPTNPRESDRLDPDRVAATIGPHSKVLLLTSPENPTGAVIDRQRAERFAELAVRHDLWVIADEVYEKFVYKGLRHTSMAMLPGMHGRTITINSFSKTYGLSGYRIGYLVAPAALMREISKIHYATTLCAAEVSQRVALAAVSGPQDWLISIIGAHELGMQRMVERLNDLPGVFCPQPDGGMFAFPDISAFGLDSMTMTEWLVREAHVASRPGHYFGRRGEGRIRFNVPPSVEIVDVVVDRLSRALERLEIPRQQAATV